ncbi:MAG: NAD(P)-dependent oxidoreductase [Myxococcales bacterium]|nr:NAD(P)-dependent oxidoreductase [Myxococcales bacterium]
MNIALTGATGFLGSHLAQGLAVDGHQLTLLVRDPGKLIGPLQTCRIVQGDLLDPVSVRAAIRDADAVLHAAAFVGEWGSHDDYFRPNVTGTQNVLDACVSGKPRRFIHISSNSVYGDGTADHIATTEDTPSRLTGQPYGDSKIEAERLVFAAHEAGRIVATAIRPGMIWGPRDRQFLPKIIDALAKGLMMFLGDGYKLLGLAHVDNIMELTRLILARDVSHGRAYNIDDDDRRTWRDLVRALCGRLGYREPRLCIPASFAKTAAVASEFLWKTAGAKKPPLISKMGVTLMCYDNDVSVERAKQELGYAPQDRFDERLDAYLQAYRAGE